MPNRNQRVGKQIIKVMKNTMTENFVSFDDEVIQTNTRLEDSLKANATIQGKEKE